MKRALTFLLALLFIVTLWSCSGHNIKTDVTTTGFLEDYSMLEKDPYKQISLKYLAPGVEWEKYNKIQLDRVVVFFKDNAKYEGVDPEDLKNLIDYFHKALFAALDDRFIFVPNPGIGTIRVRIALTDVTPSKPGLGTVTTIVPVGLAVSTVKRGAAGTGLAVGQASIEMEIIDSMSGRRLAAAVDHRAGGKKIFRNKWADTKDAMDYWATRIETLMISVGAGK